MIIMDLKGGLGNQMFQYACGRALALRNKDELKLDITRFATTKNSDTPRAYSLSAFNIYESIATQREIGIMKGVFYVIQRVYRKVLIKLGFANIEFIPRIFNAKGDIYLDGYWQTEKYFIDQAETIRKEFTLKTPPSVGMVEAQKIISDAKTKVQTVSIHIRRGDVARDATTNPYYGICTPEYFKKALDLVSQKLGSFHLFVFSDDTKWVRENIELTQPVSFISDIKNIKDYEELLLMSSCDHNIIANSSFSWWGAWLNQNPNKIVVAPKEWITKHKWQHKDTVPSSWTKV